ncbi:MAG: hypothetical protein QM785_02220 [Pyrinomonadaceae bacterium]
MPTKNELFLELAQPNAEGISRWVRVTEFVGRYAPLVFGNGADWARSDGNLAKIYILERDASLTAGNRVDQVRLNGFRQDDPGTQQIRRDILLAIRQKRCVVLGTSGVQVDHKDGRKDDPRVMNPATQLESDFQPLSTHANTAKRQFCKECKATGERYDARRLGYTISFTQGGLAYDEKIRCGGCFWHDPIAFRQTLKSNDS